MLRSAALLRVGQGVRPLVSVIGQGARFFSETTATANTSPINDLRKPHQKHKIPRKRASSLLNTLRNEEFEKLKDGRQWPEIRAGDSVQVDHLPTISSKDPVKIRGVVIAKVNRSSDSSLTILNVEGGTPVERSIKMYSPLITNITVLQKAFIHEGKKRVRRSKLYYLRSLKPELYTVSYDTKGKQSKNVASHDDD
jgi:ribosomal protein L19